MRFYIAFSLAIFVSLKGINVSPLSGAELDSGHVIVNGDYDDVSLFPDNAVETALSQMRTDLSEMRKKLETVEERLDALEKPGMS